MLSFSISYPDLIKFPYFADTTERASLWVLGEVLFSLHIGIRFVGTGIFIGNPKFTQDPMFLKGIEQ
jgi:hypothetical protein